MSNPVYTNEENALVTLWARQGTVLTVPKARRGTTASAAEVRAEEPSNVAMEDSPQALKRLFCSGDFGTTEVVP